MLYFAPRISVVLGRDQAFVSGLSELRQYWRRALRRGKRGEIEILSVGVGSNAITILYRNHRNDQVAETLEFCEDGKVIKGIVTYLSLLRPKISENLIRLTHAPISARPITTLPPERHGRQR